MNQDMTPRRRFYNGCMRVLLNISAALVAALTLFLIAYVLIRGLPNLSWQLLTTKPS